jgi:hypothetical protein
MNDRRAPHFESEPPTSSQTPSQTGRRRFLGAGAVATPAILTLASTPALGTTCFTPSRSLSRNTSAATQAGKFGTCNPGASVYDYRINKNNWPANVANCHPDNTLFHTLFSAGRFTYMNGNASQSLFSVLSNNKDSVAAALIAAHLNINGGKGSSIASVALTTQKLKDIWSEYNSAKAGYEPFAGTIWGDSEIKNYLISNYIIKSGT